MNFLGFSDWHITEIKEESAHFFVRARYEPPIEVFCIFCSANFTFLQKYGIRIKSIKDAPVRGKRVCIVLTIQRYKCAQCSRVFTVQVPELHENSRMTKRLVAYIECQSVRITFLSLSEETGVNESTVREIFTCFAEKTQRKISEICPEVLGIDDVYIARTARCILTDIRNRKIIELLPGQDSWTVSQYLLRMKGKENVKLITMDMSKPFYASAKKAFPHAEVVIDTFHVQRMANRAINLFLRKIRGSYNTSKRRKYLRDRFILMKRPYILTEKEKYILFRWRKKLAGLGQMYDLKEEFLQIWRSSDRQKAEMLYANWKQSIPPEMIFAFQDILTAVDNWHHEIFNYIDYKVTNAYTESANNLIKTIQKQGRGCSFEMVRAKILCKTHLDFPARENEIDSISDLEQGSKIKRRTGVSRLKRLKLLRESSDELFEKVRGLKTWEDRLKPYLIYIKKDN